MSEVKDFAIKLFGRTILVPHIRNESSAYPSSSSSTKEVNSFEEPSKEELAPVQDAAASHQTTKEIKSPGTSSGICENPKTPSAETEASLLKSVTNGGEQSRTSVSEEKTPKKPSEILPCPRCNSMSTKFCYYNNYNANQPRHYCKNCQRYWTAGGIVRRVPIGAGRRKIRNSSASHCHHTMVPEALQAAKLNPLNKLHDTVWGNRAATLSFGHDSPLCDTKASMMNIPERTQNSIPNVFNTTKQNRFVSFGRDDNGNDHSNGVSVTTSTSSESIGQCSSYKSMDKRFENFPPRFPSSPWPYSRNSAVPPPTFHPPGNPLSLKTAPAYWDCFSLSRNNMSGISPKSSVSYSVFSPSFGPNSHLGKHSRDGSIINPTNSQQEKLRIGGPSEAAKSSMFSKLVSMNVKANSLAGGGLCKDFPSKGNDNNNHIVEEASTVSRVNQAGLSRSDLLPFLNKPSWEFQ